MSAGKENSLTSDIPKLGIIAGSGIIPRQLQQACSNQNIETLTIGIKGATDGVAPDFWTRLGTSGKTLKILEQHGIKDMVLIGAVKRPSLFSLWPDWVTAKFFFKILFKNMGDNSLLHTVRREVEKLGFKIHGAHKFLPTLLMPEGGINNHQPNKDQQATIKKGIDESQKLGMADIGQAVIVKDKEVLAYEDSKGTSALIKKHGFKGAILVKTCKPQQDRDIDLPTIGPDTIKLCAQKEMAGIIGQADATLLVDREEVTKIADQNNMFVIGVKVNAPK